MMEGAPSNDDSGQHSTKRKAARVSTSPDKVAAPVRRSRRKSRRLKDDDGAPSVAEYSVDGGRRLEVVALMTSTASDNLNKCGYTCGGCRKRGVRFAVGTLNQGGRMIPWCIECLMDS